MCPQLILTIIPYPCLHVDRFVEAEYAVALEVAIDSVGCVLSTRICHMKARGLGSIFGWGIGDVRNEDKAGCFDRFDKGRSE